MEKEIFLCGLRQFKGKDGKTQYYTADYVRTDNGRPRTDFISAIEYTQMKQKTNEKYFQKYTGIFQINEYDKLYLSNVK